MAPERIRGEHRAILEDEARTKYVSNISFWEISLKYALRKLRLAGATPEETMDAALEAGFTILGITTERMTTSYRLGHVGAHRDPFDRLLIWQCMGANLSMLTADAEIRRYASLGLRLA
jgi:PIN domain nuclease of toxin-antitoxin system